MLMMMKAANMMKHSLKSMVASWELVLGEIWLGSMRPLIDYHLLEGRCSDPQIFDSTIFILDLSN